MSDGNVITRNPVFEAYHAVPGYDGGERFEVSLTEGSAHPRSEDEMVIFKRMLRAERLEIILGDMSGKVHAADLSYSGFLDAYQYVSEICAFQHTPVFSDPGGSTKT